MTDINNASIGLFNKKIQKKICFFTALFGIAGIALAVFMVHCRINYTTVTEIINGNRMILDYSAASSDAYAFPRIVTYFDKSSAVSIFLWLCTILTLLAVAIPTLTIPKCDLKSETKNSIFTVFASSLLGFLFAGYVVNYIITPMRPLWTKVQLPGPDLDSMTPMLKLIYYVGIVAAIPCAVYFIFIATQNEFAPNKKMCLLSVSPVIWLSLRLIFYFMSTSAHVNAAGRKLYIISLVFAIIFFIQDSKRWIPAKNDAQNGITAMKHSKLFFATGLAAVFTFAVYHLSNTYLQAFWITKPEDSYLLNGIFITITLFIAFRLTSIKKSA